jgi:hypothetical protein
MFTAVNDYVRAEDIAWANCIGINTDGAAAFAVHKKRCETKLQQTGPHVKFMLSLFIQGL